MAILITTFFTQVENSIPDRMTTEVSDANIYQQIKQAVIDYSRIRSRTLTIDLTGDGGKYYAIDSTNFPGYVDNFSRILSIEYPAHAVSTDETPVYLNAEDWTEDYFTADEQRYLFLPNHAPASTETMRIQFLGSFIWTASTSTTAVAQASHGFSVNDYIYKNASNVWVSAGGSTANLLATHQVSAVADSGNFTAKTLQVDIPENDYFAICNRAACIICTEIATRYSRTSDSTINADSVSHTTRAGEFSKRAKEFCERWATHMGISSGKDGEAKKSYLPASEFVDWDTVADMWPGRRRWLFHND